MGGNEKPGEKSDTFLFVCLFVYQVLETETVFTDDWAGNVVQCCRACLARVRS